jgi:hypothetical protein
MSIPQPPRSSTWVSGEVRLLRSDAGRACGKGAGYRVGAILCGVYCLSFVKPRVV